MKTLPQNLADNPDTDDLQVEFVVLNYGDDAKQYEELRAENPDDQELQDFDYEDMNDWMMNDPRISAEIESGRILYVRSEQPKFRMAHAKNMAHRLAEGSVVCNLDADNWTGAGFAQALAMRFKKTPNIILSPSFGVSRHFPSQERGFVGRIAVKRNNFLALGGYREAYKGWGHEDTDFTRRAKMHGLQHYRFEDLDHLQVIGHTNDDRVQNMYSTKQERRSASDMLTQYKNKGMATEFFYAGVARMKTLTRPILANAGTHFGLGQVEIVGVGQDSRYEVKPLRGVHARVFRSVGGMMEVARGRLNPRIISLKDPDGGPL